MEIESLVATIHQIRPDVISADQVPQGALPIDVKKIPKRNKIKKITESKQQLIVASN
jgi:hypothetical protein